MITEIITLALAITPLSLILIRLQSKYFSKTNPALALTSVLCTNVTGTLTENELTVKSLYFDKYLGEAESQFIYLENEENKEELELEAINLQKEPALKQIAITTTLCHYHKLHSIEIITAGFLKKCAIDSTQILNNYETISKISSNEDKKLSTVVVKNKEEGGIFAYSKGNPYSILDKCTRIYKNERNTDLTNETRRKLKDRIKRLNKNGQKIIAFAYKPLPLKRLAHYSEEFTENDLVWVGMLGLSDNINKNMKEYIEQFKEMGIKIYVLSETKERKAVAVARDLKIINPQYFEAINGEDLKDLSDQKLNKMLSNKEKDFVFCELNETQKEQVIELLKNSGEVIAYANREHSVKKIIRGIQAAKREELNSRRLFAHSLVCKIIQSLLVLSAIMLRAPMPFTIGGILALELLINLSLEFSLKTEVTKQPTISRKEIIITSSLYALIIGGIYYWSLIRFGWIPGGEVLTDKAIAISSTLVLLILSLMQILRAYFFGHISNIYLSATSIISLLFIYSFFNYMPATFGVTAISGFEWSIIAFSLVLILVIHAIKQYAITKK